MPTWLIAGALFVGFLAPEFANAATPSQTHAAERTSRCQVALASLVALEVDYLSTLVTRDSYRAQLYYLRDRLRILPRSMKGLQSRLRKADSELNAMDPARNSRQDVWLARRRGATEEERSNFEKAIQVQRAEQRAAERVSHEVIDTLRDLEKHLQTLGHKHRKLRRQADQCRSKGNAR